MRPEADAQRSRSGAKGDPVPKAGSLLPSFFRHRTPNLPDASTVLRVQDFSVRFYRGRCHLVLALAVFRLSHPGPVRAIEVRFPKF